MQGRCFSSRNLELEGSKMRETILKTEERMSTWNKVKEKKQKTLCVCVCVCMHGCVCVRMHAWECVCVCVRMRAHVCVMHNPNLDCFIILHSAQSAIMLIKQLTFKCDPPPPL